jgi:hypothetical protein
VEAEAVTAGDKPQVCVRCGAEAVGLAFGPEGEGQPRLVSPSCAECGPAITQHLSNVAASQAKLAKDRRPQA